MGIGIIVRDHEGCVLAATCDSKSYITDPVIAKLLAALFAFVLSCDLGV